MYSSAEKTTRDRFSLPDKVNGWLLDIGLTNINKDCDHPTFQYRKKINGQRYKIFVEDEGDGLFGGMVDDSGHNPHTDPLDKFTDAESVEEAFNKAQEWMENENFLNRH